MGNVAKRRALKSAAQQADSAVSAGRGIGRFRPYKAEVGGSKPPAPTGNLFEAFPRVDLTADEFGPRWESESVETREE